MAKQKMLVFSIEYRCAPEDADLPSVLSALGGNADSAMHLRGEARVTDVRIVSVETGHHQPQHQPQPDEGES